MNRTDGVCWKMRGTLDQRNNRRDAADIKYCTRFVTPAAQTVLSQKSLVDDTSDVDEDELNADQSETDQEALGE